MVAGVAQEIDTPLGVGNRPGSADGREARRQRPDQAPAGDPRGYAAWAVERSLPAPRPEDT